MTRLVQGWVLWAMTFGGLHPTQGWAQNPNGVGTGFTKAMYDKCRVVSSSDMAGTAAMAVFPDTLNKNTFGVSSVVDPTNEFKLVCASQLRKNRCTKEMIAALGEAYNTIAANAMGAGMLPSAPASASLRDPVVIGTVVGGAAGLVKGAQLGHPVLGALGGAYVGNKAGKLIGEATGTWAPAGSCAYRQLELSRIAARLQTPPSALLTPLAIDAGSAQTVLDDNVSANHVTLQEAAELRREIALLTGRLSQIMVVINQ